MKILHFLFSFYPDSFGGTEVYAASLANELRADGVEAVIVAAASEGARYLHDGLRVRRIAVFGHDDSVGAAEFAAVLDDERPDIVHIHAFPRIGLALVREAKARMIPVLLTYHTPSTTCQRNTMYRWGERPCDGVMRLRPCSRCTLHGLGWNRPFATAAGSLSGPASAVAARFGAWLEKRGASGKIPRLLKKANRLAERHESVQRMLAEVDHIVAVCDWARQVLLRNGVSQTKITLSRHGIQRDDPVDSPISALPGAPLRVACLSRLDPMKGIDILVRSVRAAPDLAVRLDIYAVPYGKAGDRYEYNLREIAGDDTRIAILPPVPPRRIVPTLGAYDVLAVPSQCLETGPLVILEAFAAGIPVIGSRLGGIAELVADGRNGILVEPASLPSWRDALSRLHNDRLFLKQLRDGITPPRTMREVASEMLDLYAKLLNTTPMASVQRQEHD